jgi:hypothetical protein
VRRFRTLAIVVEFFRCLEVTFDVTPSGDVIVDDMVEEDSTWVSTAALDNCCKNPFSS